MSITISEWFLFGSISLLSILSLLILLSLWQQRKLTNAVLRNAIDISKVQSIFTEKLHRIEKELLKHLHEGQFNGLQRIQSSLRQGITEVREQVLAILQQNTTHVSQSIDKLTQETERRLHHISGQVDKRLTEGFEKTTATFTDVIKRLALIDEAQKKITELSTNVVSLQEILADKRSRGTFGETQLAGLLHNMLPTQHFSLQHKLSNGTRADCILFLPEPSGNIVIDSKFPLESYRIMNNNELGEFERRQAEQQFRIDVRRHISDIAAKYIIAEETSDGAIMFIPAEAIFAEIHSRFPEIVEESFRVRVWLASPTTLMAILTTARAVVKDAATRKQIHIIQQHLVALAKDFQLFEKRMGSLAKHIEQAHQDVTDVNISAKKIASRFHKIESVDVDNLDGEITNKLEVSEI